MKIRTIPNNQIEGSARPVLARLKALMCEGARDELTTSNPSDQEPLIDLLVDLAGVGSWEDQLRAMRTAEWDWDSAMNSIANAAPPGELKALISALREVEPETWPTP